MQGRHCNFYNTQRINGSRTHLFCTRQGEVCHRRRYSLLFCPSPSPVLSLSEILLNHVSPVTHAAALILASDSFGRPSASFVLPYPAPVRSFAAFVFASDSFGRPSAAFVFVPGSSGRDSAAFMMPCIDSVYDLNRISKINIALSVI